MRAIRTLAALLIGGASAAMAQGAGAAPFIPATAASAAASPSQTATFNVYLPIQNEAALQTLLTAQQTPGSPSYHKWLTAAQFNAQFGPNAAAMASAIASLKAQGLTVIGTQGRAIHVSGTIATIGKAFSTSFLAVQPQSGPSKLVANSALTLPAALKAQGALVPAFSGLPRLHKHSKLAVAPSLSAPASREGPAGGYFFDDLKQAYGYPSYQAYDGTGANVAVLMSSDALDQDIAYIFNADAYGFMSKKLGGPYHENFTAITGKAAPTINHLPVDQAAPTFTDALDEASLDVQEVLGGAPAANVTLVDIPDLSDQSIIDGYYTIVTTNDPKTNKPYQLVNSSFGGCELTYLPAYNNGIDFSYILGIYQSIFEQGNAEGITFVASSGDSGGLGCPDTTYFSSLFGSQPVKPARFVAGVEFPASSPNVTAVGGGNLVTSYDYPAALTSTYVSENAEGDPELPYDVYGFGANVYGGYWGAGGGISSIFSKPDYQGLVNTASSTSRTVPDVGMQVGGCPGGISITPCGPNRSYVIVAIQSNPDPAHYVGFSGLIGTSVSSPEFVGALALYVQKNGGSLGNVNRYLYQQGATQNGGGAVVYNRYIPGFDGKYSDKAPTGGYDYLVGNGTPQVGKLFGLGPTVAGAPQTPSNP